MWWVRLGGGRWLVTGMITRGRWDSPEFAWIPAKFATNWWTVCQKLSSSPATFKYSANDGSLQTIVHSKSSPRTVFGRTVVRQLANSFAVNSWRTRSRRTIAGGQANVHRIFESIRRRRHFWRTVRQFAANSERIRANSGEFAESSANVRRTLAEFARKMLANCWRTWSEFARIRANLRELARVCGKRPRRSPSQVPLIVVIA